MDSVTSIRVKGRYACWTHPASVVERLSYDVPTPSGVQGVVEAIYWKPEFYWRVHEIRVLSSLRWHRLMTNEVTKSGFISDINGYRTQRSSVILCDVDYVFTVSPYPLRLATGSYVGDVRKHSEIFRRRLLRGDYFRQPYLGMSDYLASSVELVEGELPESPLRGRVDLGVMYHSMNWDDRGRRFYRPEMVNGVINVPDLWSEGVLSHAN